MKKRNLFILALLMISSVSTLHAQIFEKGNAVGNLTIGFGSGLYTGGGYTSSVPPIAVSLDYGVVNNVFDKGTIGLGGYLGYASAKWNSGYYDWGYKYTNIVIGPRGTLHYPFVDKLDTYAGLMIGYNIVSAKWTGTGSSLYSASSGGLITAGFIGARYYFNSNFAGVAELGWGVAYFNIGISYKFK